jgi:hypothetical protein
MKTRASGVYAIVKQDAPRKLPLLGLGNELVWQSINDTNLNAAIKLTGSKVGRYPGKKLMGVLFSRSVEFC